MLFIIKKVSIGEEKLITAEEVLTYLNKIAKGIADTFGPDCETLVIDMDNQAHAILSINNGHVTGRSIGGPASALALDAVRSNEKGRDLTSFRSVLENGHSIKTSVFSVYDSDSKRTFVLVINFDYTRLLTGMMSMENLTRIQLQDTHNVFYQNTNELFTKMLNEAIDQIGHSPKDMTRAERIQVVRTLNEKGGLLIQRSVQTLAESLGVSRCTIYNYLKEIQSQGDHRQ